MSSIPWDENALPRVPLALPVPAAHKTSAVSASLTTPVASSFTWQCALSAVMLFSVFYIAEHEFTLSIVIQSLGEANFVDEELDETVSEGSLLRKVAFPALGLWGLILCLCPARSNLDLTRFLLHPITWLICALLALTISSVLWADLFGFSLKRVIVVAFGVLAAFGLARGHTARQLTNILIVVILGYIALGVFAEIAVGTFRPWQSEYRFSGTTHPNNQAVMNGVLILACLSRLMTDRKLNYWLIAIMAFTFVIMILTKSRTVLFGCLIAMSVLTMLKTRWQYAAIAGFLTTTALAGFLCFAGLAHLDIADDVFEIFTLGRTDETSTLTGRIPLWQELFKDINQRPFLGHGYGSFWTPERTLRISLNQGWQIPHAHSGYVETLLNLGYLGLMLVLATMAMATLCSLYRCLTRSRMEDLFSLGLFLYAMVFSLTDTAFAAPTLPALILITMLWSLSLSYTSPQSLPPEHPT